MVNSFKNRIEETGVMPADQFLFNPSNPRKHPDKQRKAVRASLNSLGFVAPVIVNLASGYLLDGHERVWQALQKGDTTPVPYVGIRLDDAEERQFLATFDYITYMATFDAEIMGELIAQIQTQDEDMQALLDEMNQTLVASFMDTPPASTDEDNAPPDTRADEFVANWVVVIYCDDETHQLQLIEKFLDEGLNVKAMSG